MLLQRPMDEELILRGLNPAQRTAVTSPASVLQILAPPGSGKTKTLASRLAYLLVHDQYKPWNILCLTFTIKSAKEMKERIRKLTGNVLGSKLVLGTFHSVCRRYLVTYGYLIGIRKGFGIADSSDSIGIITRIVKRLKLNIEPKAARSRISSSKAKNVSYQDLVLQAAKKQNVDQQEFVTVFEAYESHLSTSNLLDYDDLLLRCADLLRAYPACVSNVEVVLIDEFQDTNTVQFDLMRLFASKYQRITTVGDPDQSIYGWRSAEIKNLRKMQKEYPDTLVIHLEANYRSSGAILLAALEVIQQDESRPSKPLLPTHCPGTIPVLRRLPSPAAEASWIVREIFRSTALTGSLLKFSDFSVLLRSASLSRQIESAMGKAGIPYRMVGGQRFFDRVEIKILLDYLRVISQPANSDALARIINVPSRRIGDATIKALLEEAASRRLTLWDLVQCTVRGESSARTKVSKVAQQGLSSITNLILTARNRMLDVNSGYMPHQLLHHITQKLEFQQFLERTHPEDHESRWANVEELVAQASDCSIAVVEEISATNEVDDDQLPVIDGLEQQTGNKSEVALVKFLANVALSTELQREEENKSDQGPQERVTISTIHAAKGLEWPVVFIPAVYEGSIPHSRAEDTDEERRLLYVAMTRAQALLYMSCPTRNTMKEETTLSPFLSAKQVTRYMTDQGPSLRFTTTIDISRILGRDCPSETMLLEGMSKVDSLEDDLWPLSGEENPEMVEALWNGTANRDHHTSGAFPSKRRKIAASTSTAQLNYPFSTLHDPTIPALPHFKTTMEQESTYTTVSQMGGFVSATSQLQHMQSYGKKTTMSSEIKDGASRLGNKNTKIGDNDRAGLMKYWGSSKAEPKTAVVEEHDSISAHLIKTADCSETRRSGKPKHVDDVTAIACSTTWRPAPATTVSRHTTDSIPRKPMAIIPQALTRRSDQPYTASTRPRVIMPDKYSAQPYVFLSSSPPPVNDVVDEALPKNNNGVYATQKSNTAENSVAVTETVNVFRPSATCHVTSIAKVHARNQSSRKTLGVRRSMVGWSVRGQGDHQFAKPRMLG